MSKVYFWLKLNQDFFEDDTIAWVEEQPNGKNYVLFYLKLALKSLSDDGKLIRYVGEKLIPYDVQALSKLTNTDVDTVKVAMNLFIEIGLIEILDTGEIYLNQIKEMTGSETDAAKRMRKSRAKQKLLTNKECNNVTKKCNNVQKSYTEIELELDKEIEIDKDTLSSSDEHDSPSEKIPYKVIVSYLNEKTGSKYQSTTGRTQTLIKARFNEGFSVDDFKRVIDIKTDEWLNDPKMAKYLRPETLFGTKFEGYLNQEHTGQIKIADYQPTEEDYEAYERLLAEGWGNSAN